METETMPSEELSSPAAVTEDPPSSPVHVNGEVNGSSEEADSPPAKKVRVSESSVVSDHDTPVKVNNVKPDNHKNGEVSDDNVSKNGDGDDVMEVEDDDDVQQIDEVQQIDDEDIQEVPDDDISEIIEEKKSGDPLDSDSDKKNENGTSSETNSNETTPNKQKIKDERRKSAEAKRQALLNITPRRSSRNIHKTKKYIDGEPEPDEPDIEEIMPVDPLAVSATERVKMNADKDPLAATPEKEPPVKVRRKNTIIVNDTKALAQIAANSKEGKKEPTLVIIDTNSILSGRGPVPVNHNSSPSLPAALPAQGIYPVMPVPRQSTPPKPQPPPPAPKPKGPVGLTDDMYVVEAPSFIVPYVYEKPPKEPLKEVVEKMGKILREQDKKDREERQKEKKRKEKEREEREKKKEEDKLLKEKEKQEKKDKGEEDMEVDKETPKKTDGEEKEKGEGSDEEEAKADHDSDYKADSVKDKDSEDEDIEYDSESDSSTSGASPSKPKATSYFESPLGKFFMQIGVNLVQEHVQTDLLRMQKRKLSKGGSNNPETQIAVHSLIKNLEQSKENNEPYKFKLHKCKFCNFKTESNIVLANHLEVPHLRNFMYHCNFCPVALRTNHDILFHMEAEHNISGRIERAPAFHQCPNCPFEDNQKSKMTRHALSCSKRFRPERNCEPPMDWEPPAKIPRMAKNRPSALPSSQAAAQYMAQRAQAMPQHPLLPKIPSASMMPSLVAGAVRGRGRPSITSRFLPDLKAMPRAIAPSQLRQGGMLYQPNSRQQVLVPTSYQIAGNQIFQRWSQQVGSGQNQMASAMPRLTLMPHGGSSSSSSVALMPNLSGGSNSITIQSSSSNKSSPAAKLLQQPSISITPLPRQPSSSSSSANFSSHSSSKQHQQQAQQQAQMGGGGGGKNSFVICEICDGYIKDLEQLRNHMQWIHKVKIHPKMIYNRPPLNCQKCQFRFFTDQGLERHLLGSHGLVTSSMQEASNKGKDGGRCPVCGRVYQWKLLNHVAKDHNMTLKPAHLSYKCTVCTATFGMYKQFENHVYSAHSVVAKRVMDKKAANASSTSRSFSHNAAESLLKPLKINDEITIIPQPAKMSSSNRNRKAACQVCSMVLPVETIVLHYVKTHLKECTIQMCRVDKCKTCKNKHTKLKLNLQTSHLYSMLSRPLPSEPSTIMPTLSSIVKQQTGQAVLLPAPSIIKSVLPPSHIIYSGQSTIPALAPNQIIQMLAPGQFLPSSNYVQIRVVKPGEETDLYLTPNIVYGKSSDDNNQ